MAPLTIPFDREYLPKVRDFQCGTTPWAVAAADWIKSAPPFLSALQSMDRYGTTVWLHFMEDPASAVPDLCAFSSLGPTRMAVPYPDGSRKYIQYIPMMAVALEYQGKLMEDGRKVSAAVLEHIIVVARERPADDLGLQVHIDNAVAISLYTKFGFLTNGVPDARGLLRMLKRLR